MASSVEAIEKARQRRLDRAAEQSAKTEWFIDQVSNKVTLTVKARIKLATELVRNKTVVNISRPVTKEVVTRFTKVQGANGKTRKKKVKRVRVSDRSKPGEYPKADTTQLMKTIFGTVVETSPGIWDGYVGTPIDYGVILELKMDRSFLVRTLREELSKVMKIITGPMKA